MRGRVARLAASALMAVGPLVVATSHAAADTVCQKTDPSTGACQITVEVPSTATSSTPPASEGPKDTGTGSACYWDGTRQGITDPPPGPVPCSKSYGYWSNASDCYIDEVTLQPPAGDPVWQGHEPGDGAVYECFQPQTSLLTTLWAQSPPPNSGAGPTPRDVAQVAISRMNLSAINIGIAPQPGAGSVGIVGMPVWMWAANRSARTVGPTTSSASAGGITVTATARLQKVTWDMGDGTTVICRGPGTAYKPAYGDSESPDCGHRYTRSSSREPHGTYTVTATSDWAITWQGAGQSGTIRLNGLTRSVEIAVGEAQVLVQ